MSHVFPVFMMLPGDVSKQKITLHNKHVRSLTKIQTVKEEIKKKIQECRWYFPCWFVSQRRYTTSFVFVSC